jgi:hypothetical protein
MPGEDGARRTRLFALASARVPPPGGGEPLSMHSFVTAAVPPERAGGLPEEWQAALRICADAPRAVAEVAARLHLPLSATVAMLTELAGRGLLHHQPPPNEEHAWDATLLHRIRQGLQAL